MEKHTPLHRRSGGVGLLIASLFMGCNLYEKEEVQVIRCPRIETDTVAVPEWESEQGEAAEDVGH